MSQTRHTKTLRRGDIPAQPPPIFSAKDSLLRLFTPGVRCGRKEFAAVTLTAAVILPLLFVPGFLWLGTGIAVYDYGTGAPSDAESLRLFLWGTLQILCLVPAFALLVLIPITACRRLGDAGRSRWFALTLLLPPIPLSTLIVLAVLGFLPEQKEAS